MVKNTEITTIKLEKRTKARLDKLRVYKRETYDEILNNLVNILNLCRINPDQAKAKLKKMDLARQDREPIETKAKVSQQSSGPQHNHQA